MSSIPTKHIDGDVSVGRNVTCGGDAKVRGNAVVDHDLKVGGWLDAPNVKACNKGVFLTEDSLREAYPDPEDGWWAVVGVGLPGPIYVAIGGEWVDSGGVGGNPSVDGGPAVAAAGELATKAMRVASEAKEGVNGIIDSKGKSGGIAPLDGSGKVAAEYLPSYVDDVVEFADFIDLEYRNFIGCFDEIPEQYADYQFNGSGNFLQYYEEKSDAYYIPGKGIVLGQIISVYNGHSEVAIFAINDQTIDRGAFGVVGDNGCITPVAGKIYVCTRDDSQYRWSGTQLTMLSSPIALGDGFGEAFPGASGAQLRSRLEDLSELSEKKFEAVQTILYGLNTFNVTAYAFNSEPMSGLSEALDNLPDQSVCYLYSWPTYGSAITFLTATGWVRYRYMMMNEGEGDEGRLDASNWVRIIDSAGGGSSGSGSCQLCEQNAEGL